MIAMKAVALQQGPKNCIHHTDHRNTFGSDTLNDWPYVEAINQPWAVSAAVMITPITEKSERH